MSLPKLFYNQLTLKLPIPTKNLSGQTYIITGANTGLGLESARTVARLGVSKLIIACRSVPKGEEAKASILESASRTNEPDFISVWPLDLNSYPSVLEFAKRCNSIDRIDVLLENAGVDNKKFQTTEAGDELTIMTNVLSTIFLAILLLPKLREVSVKYRITPMITMVNSQVHAMVNFPEWKEDHILDALSNEKHARMSERYFLSKLLLMFAFREMSAKMTASSKQGKVALNNVAPGLCYSNLFRNDPNWNGVVMSTMMKLFARSTEEGSRFLLTACFAGEDSHGKYFNDGSVQEPSKFVRSKNGAEAQTKLWREIMEKLQRVMPAVEGLI